MDNINDLIANLSSQDMEMLKGVASSILGGNDNNGQQSDFGSSPQMQNNNPMPQQNNGMGQFAQSSSQNPLAGLGDLNFSQSDFQMMMKAKSVFDKMNNTKSKNADLIMALRPHLSEKTQDKADQALKILRLFEVLPLLKDVF